VLLYSLFHVCCDCAVCICCLCGVMISSLHVLRTVSKWRVTSEGFSHINVLCMCVQLSRARSLVDNKAPPNFGHVHQNMRRLKVDRSYFLILWSLRPRLMIIRQTRITQTQCEDGKINNYHHITTSHWPTMNDSGVNKSP